MDTIVGLFIIIIFTTLSWNAYDVINISNRYNNPRLYNGDLAVTFDFLMNSFRAMGASYEVFKAFIVIIQVILLYQIFKKSTKEMAFCCAMFLIFPFFGFAAQMRNSLSGVIAAYAIISYIYDYKKFATLKYCILIILAASIHLASLIYLLFILFKPRKRPMEYQQTIENDVRSIRKNKRLRNYLIISVLFSIFVYVILNNGNLRTILESITDSERNLKWVKSTSTVTLINFLLPALGQVAGTVLLVYCAKIIRRRKFNSVTNINEIDALISMNYLLFTIIPLYLVSSMYFRLFKYVLILNYGVYAQAIFETKISRTKRILLLLLVVGYALVVWFMYTYSMGFKGLIDYLMSYSPLEIYKGL